MPAVSTISLTDAQATPVTHDFVPLGPDKNGTWWFEDQSAPSAIGYNKLSMLLTRPNPATAGESDQNRVARVKFTFYTPVLANVTNSTVSGVEPAAQVAYIPRCHLEYVLPERSTSANRADIFEYSKGLLTKAIAVSMVVDLQNIY